MNNSSPAFVSETNTDDILIPDVQHPAALHFLNLFRNRESAARADQAKKDITLADLAAMPRLAQLLLAHALKKGNPDLMLMESDTDVSALISAGWLRSVSSSTVGIVCFKIKAHIWRQLKWLRGQFPDRLLSLELTSYRKQKSALYPWNWW